MEERLLVRACSRSEVCSIDGTKLLTFSSTKSFRLFQENSKTAMMMEMNMPPTRTMKTPPRFARLSWELEPPPSALQEPPPRSFSHHLIFSSFRTPSSCSERTPAEMAAV